MISSSIGPIRCEEGPSSGCASAMPAAPMSATKVSRRRAIMGSFEALLEHRNRHCGDRRRVDPPRQGAVGAGPGALNAACYVGVRDLVRGVADEEARAPKRRQTLDEAASLALVPGEVGQVGFDIPDG